MIIVTLSVVCTLKGMSRWSIQRIKAMLLCIEYGILFVNTVNTKIKAYKALNAIYVDTVDTRQGSLMHSMLSMSTLLIQFSHLIVLCIRCRVRATNTSVDSVDKHSIKCIACFDLHIDSVDKKDTLLNRQKHCFDLLY